jgi:pro-sigmaK processing inhibitor BofA
VKNTWGATCVRDYIIIAIAACVCGFLILLLRSSKTAKGLAINSIAGFAALGVVNLTALITGTYIAVNVWTIIISAVLGLPGVTGMMFLKILWKI